MNPKKLTQAEREQIDLLKRSGQTIPQIALALGTSRECIRKWWRRGRDEGMLGLLERKRGRPSKECFLHIQTRCERPV
jgi:transposase